MILPDEIAGRIVDLAFLHKIRSLNDFKHEIEWKDISRYAAQLWPMVEAYIHCHSAAVATAAAAPLFNGSASAHLNKAANANLKAKPKPRAVGTRRCGACGGIGHYSKSLSSYATFPAIMTAQGTTNDARSIPRTHNDNPPHLPLQTTLPLPRLVLHRQILCCKKMRTLYLLILHIP